jgi:hypothetical protein
MLIEGLVLDSTKVISYRPGGRDEDAAPYADVKNRPYGVKNQVAFMASSPHDALFVPPEIPAATHDREIVKKNYE